MPARFRIEVPATSANLGPGFDTLALALDLTNALTVTVTPDCRDVVLLGSTHPTDNLVCAAYRRWSEATEAPVCGARLSLDAQIPIGRGLGSSAACVVSGLTAAACASGAVVDSDRILDLAAEMEGHADNAAAAILGGITVAMHGEHGARAIRIAQDAPLDIALFIPDEPLLTSTARDSLPASVPLRDAVFNVARAAYLVAAICGGRWEDLGAGMQDRLHQPYRARLLPQLRGLIEAACAAGALGAALSGAGPTIIALCPPGSASVVATAMAERARSQEYSGSAVESRIRANGLQVEQLPPLSSP